MSTGVTGVWRLATAIGAAIANPMIPPTRPLPRSCRESHWSLEEAATAAATPTMPPTTAPTNSPRFPTPFPRIDPITAPRPASIQAMRKAGMGLNSTS